MAAMAFNDLLADRQADAGPFIGTLVVQTFEDTMVLNIPDSLLEQSLSRSSVYWKALPLRPGLYRLSLAVKDVNSGDTGTLELRMEVPLFLEDQLATSSLILADQIE